MFLGEKQKKNSEREINKFITCMKISVLCSNREVEASREITDWSVP